MSIETPEATTLRPVAWLPDAIPPGGPARSAGLTHEQWLAFVRGAARRLAPGLLPIVLLAAWQLASAFGWLSTRVLPAPAEVAKAGWTLAASGELWTHVRVSAGRAFLGLAVGGGLGLLLGLVTGSFHWAETCCTPASRCCATSRRWR